MTLDKNAVFAGRILLLGEETGLGAAIETCLRNQGRSVQRAACQMEAVERVRSEQPDIVMMDAQTPRSSAFGLCQAIRQDPSLNSVKLLMLQGSGRDIDRRRAVALGADGVLATPFPLTKLREEVGRLLDA